MSDLADKFVEAAEEGLHDPTPAASGFRGRLDQALKSRQQLLRQIEGLETKLLDVNKSYQREDGSFDSVQLKRDEVMLGRLSRQLAELDRSYSQASSAAERWADYAKRQGANFLRGNMAGVPEALREPLRQSFQADLAQLQREGYWEDSAVQKPEQVAGIIERIFDSAWGRLERTQGAAAAPERERGLDAGNEPEEEPAPEDRFGDDTLARGIVERWQQRRDQGRQTLADRLRGADRG